MNAGANMNNNTIKNRRFSETLNSLRKNLNKITDNNPKINGKIRVILGISFNNITNKSYGVITSTLPPLTNVSSV